MVARCSIRACAAVTTLDISPDLYAALRHASLDRLEDQLRCTCGARRGALEAWTAQRPIRAERERLFLFVA